MLRKSLLIALLLRTMVGPAYAGMNENYDKFLAYGKDRLAAQQASVVGFPIPLPPLKYSQPYTGLLNVVKAGDYSVLRSLCNSKTAVACSIRSETSCLIMLGPMVWDNEKALRHEEGHCNGWPATHEGGRL